MKIKSKQRRSSNTIPVGLHNVYIAQIKYKRDSANKVETYEDGTPKALEITFKTDEGLKWDETFWLTEKAIIYRLDPFCNAIDVDIINGGVDVNTLIGKKRLYILVVKEIYRKSNGEVATNDWGDEIFRKNIAKFYRHGTIPPSINGDPDDKNPAGAYLVERSYEEAFKSRK